MGMIGNYLRVSRKELEEYLNDSSKLDDRLYAEGNTEDPSLIDVDKSWEAIFFLLTGESVASLDQPKPPLSWMLQAPNEIDPDQDMGYGPATYTTPEQTKELSDAFNAISQDELTKRYNGDKMNGMGIYPEIWHENISREYAFDNLSTLKDFYNKASVNSEAVIVFIN